MALELSQSEIILLNMAQDIAKQPTTSSRSTTNVYGQYPLYTYTANNVGNIFAELLSRIQEILRAE